MGNIKENFLKTCDSMGLNPESILDKLMQNFITETSIEDTTDTIETNVGKYNIYSKKHYEIQVKRKSSSLQDSKEIWCNYHNCSCDKNDINRWYKKALKKKEQSKGSITDIRVRLITKSENVGYVIVDPKEFLENSNEVKLENDLLKLTDTSLEILKNNIEQFVGLFRGITNYHNKLDFVPYMKELFDKFKNNESFYSMTPRQTYLTTFLQILVLHKSLCTEKDISIGIRSKNNSYTRFFLSRLKDLIRYSYLKDVLEIVIEGKPYNLDCFYIKNNYTGKYIKICEYFYHTKEQRENEDTKYDLIIHNDCIATEDKDIQVIGSVYRSLLDDYKCENLYIPRWEDVFVTEDRLFSYIVGMSKLLTIIDPLTFQKEIFLRDNKNDHNPFIDSIYEIKNIPDSVKDIIR